MITLMYNELGLAFFKSFTRAHLGPVKVAVRPELLGRADDKAESD